MTRPPGRRSAPETDNSSLILGILVGMVLGLIIAGAVAWHLSKRPNSFNGKSDAPVAQASAPVAATPPRPHTPSPQSGSKPAQPASGIATDKQQYEFYKILTDKEVSTPKPHPQTQPQGNSTPPKTATPLFLQAGSFDSQGDAENLKGKLAFLGLETSVKHADVAGKVKYRVFVGPFQSADELNKAKAVLAQNGIKDAFTVRAVPN